MKLNKKLFFRIIISVLFLVFLFIIVKPAEIISTINQAKLNWVLLVFLFLPVNLLFQFFRWQYLVKNCVAFYDNKEILKSIFYSFSYSIFTPARLGDIGRAFHITHTKKQELVAFAVYEKLFAFISLFFMGTLALSVHKHPLFLVCSAVSIVLLSYSHKIANFIPKLKDHTKKLNRIRPLKLFAISILFIFIYVIQFYFALRAFHPIDLIPSFFLIILVIFFNSIPIALSGLGVREILSIYFFKNIGIAAPQAASAALLIFFIYILIPTFIGFILHLLPIKNK